LLSVAVARVLDDPLERGVELVAKPIEPGRETDDEDHRDFPDHAPRHREPPAIAS
jgi:hypothetical protein